MRPRRSFRLLGPPRHFGRGEARDVGGRCQGVCPMRGTPLQRSMIDMALKHFKLFTAGALALAAAGALGGCGYSGSSSGADARSPAFSWLRPSAPPRAWEASELPDGSASMAYPLSFRPIRSDPGTVSAADRSPAGAIQGYLNATPREGSESLANWSTFRLDHNGDEGDVDVREIASATDLRFRNGRGSCVIDAYTSSTGEAYREIACIVAGEWATTVVVGAAPPPAWPTQAPAIERAISSFLT